MVAPARTLLLALLVGSCAGGQSVGERFEAPPSAIPSWPVDREEHQLNRTAGPPDLPRCRSATPFITQDSIGPLFAGQTLEELFATCPATRPGWDWGDEGIPEPGAVVQLGEAVVWIALEDTLPTSHVLRLEVWNPQARTVEGVGPSALFSQVQRIYGALESLGEGECVLLASFRSQPRLAWRLHLGPDFDCVDVVRFAEAGASASLPPDTRVQAVIQFVEPGA